MPRHHPHEALQHSGPENLTRYILGSSFNNSEAPPWSGAGLAAHVDQIRIPSGGGGGVGGGVPLGVMLTAGVCQEGKADVAGMFSLCFTPNLRYWMQYKGITKLLRKRRNALLLEA